MIHLGGQAAVVVPVSDFLRLQALKEAASPQELGPILDILAANNFRYYVDTTDRMKRRPFVDKDTYLNFDAFLNIYAIRQ